MAVLHSAASGGLQMYVPVWKAASTSVTALLAKQGWAGPHAKPLNPKKWRRGRCAAYYSDDRSTMEARLGAKASLCGIISAYLRTFGLGLFCVFVFVFW